MDNYVVVLEVMCDGRYAGQIPYRYNPLFPISFKKVSAYVRKRMPSIKDRKINIDFIAAMKADKYNKNKVYRKEGK